MMACLRLAASRWLGSGCGKQGSVETRFTQKPEMTPEALNTGTEPSRGAATLHAGRLAKRQLKHSEETWRG